MALPAAQAKLSLCRSRAPPVSSVPSRSLNQQHTQPGEARRPKGLTAARPFQGPPVASEGQGDHRLHVAATRDPETAKEGWWERDSAENMVDVTSLRGLMSELENARDKLVIVDFYAQWCSSCRSLYPKLCKLARSNPDIVFLKVNWSDNKALCKSIGIKALPFFHFYRGAEGRVEAFSASITKFKRLKDAIELHNTPRCSLGPPISPNELMSSSLVSEEKSATLPDAGKKASGNFTPSSASPREKVPA